MGDTKIFVALRARPMNKAEIAQNDQNCMFQTETVGGIKLVKPELDAQGNNRPREKTFQLSASFGLEDGKMDETTSIIPDTKDVRDRIRVQEFLSWLRIRDPTVPNLDKLDTTALKSYIDRFAHKFLEDGGVSPSTMRQRLFYEQVGSRILNSCLQGGEAGYDCCALCYGQTSSGKTYTMFGQSIANCFDEHGVPGPDAGLVPLLLYNLFQQIDSDKSEMRMVRVRLGMVEVYNETVRDLLDPALRNSKNKPTLELAQTKGGGGFYMPKQRWLAIDNCRTAADLIQLGYSNATVAATQMNDRSSRAHTILSIKIQSVMVQPGNGGLSFEEAETKMREFGGARVATVHMVDLAGNENAKNAGTADVQGGTGPDSEKHGNIAETKRINQSLLQLGNVVEHLAKKGAVPDFAFRGSVLTRIIKNGFGGNAVTVVIGCASRALSNYATTKNTLLFVEKCTNVQLKPVIHEDPTMRMIRELKEAQLQLTNELTEARAEIARLKNSGLEGNADEKELFVQLRALTEKQRSLAACNNQLLDLENENRPWADQLKDTMAVLDVAKKDREDKHVLLWRLAAANAGVRGMAVTHAAEVAAEERKMHSSAFLQLILKDSFLTGSVIRLLNPEGTTIIGSSLDCDLVIPGQGIEPHHCIIDAHDGEYFLSPCPSVNVTAANNDPSAIVTSNARGLSELDAQKSQQMVTAVFMDGDTVSDRVKLVEGCTIVFGIDSAFQFHDPKNRPASEAETVIAGADRSSGIEFEDAIAKVREKHFHAQKTKMKAVDLLLQGANLRRRDRVKAFLENIRKANTLSQQLGRDTHFVPKADFILNNSSTSQSFRLQLERLERMNLVALQYVNNSLVSFINEVDFNDLVQKMQGRFEALMTLQLDDVARFKMPDRPSLEQVATVDKEMQKSDPLFDNFIELKLGRVSLCMRAASPDISIPVKVYDHRLVRPPSRHVQLVGPVVVFDNPAVRLADVMVVTIWLEDDAVRQNDGRLVFVTSSGKNDPNWTTLFYGKFEGKVATIHQQVVPGMLSVARMFSADRTQTVQKVLLQSSPDPSSVPLVMQTLTKNDDPFGPAPNTGLTTSKSGLQKKSGPAVSFAPDNASVLSPLSEDESQLHDSDTIDIDNNNNNNNDDDNDEDSDFFPSASVGVPESTLALGNGRESPNSFFGDGERGGGGGGRGRLGIMSTPPPLSPTPSTLSLLSPDGGKMDEDLLNSAPDISQYFQKHRLQEKFEDILTSVLVNRPENPWAFLSQKISELSAAHVTQETAAPALQRSNTRKLTMQAVRPGAIDRKSVIVEEAELTSGPLAVVYRGSFNNRMRWTRVSVEMVRSSLLSERSIAAIAQDVRLMPFTKIVHPNIVRFYGITTSASEVGLVHEMMDETLRSLLTRSGSEMPLISRLDLGLHIALGLRVLHEQGIPHGALTPHNIFVLKTPEGELHAKIACCAESIVCPPEAVAQKLLERDIAWKAPEVLRDEDYSGEIDLLNNNNGASAGLADGKSSGYALEGDVYAFGVILWELTTGNVPWEKETLPMIFTSVTEKQGRPDSSVEWPNSDQIASIKPLIQSCWAESPSERPQAHIIQAQFSKLLEDLRPPPVLSKPYVFFSYNWSQQGGVKRVLAAVRKQGFNVWIDLEQMAGNCNIAEKMSEGVEEAAVVCCFVSKEYCLSKNCVLENEYAVSQNKPITWVKFDANPAEWKRVVRMNMGSAKYVSLADAEELPEDKFQAGIRDLVKHLKSNLDGTKPTK